MGIGVAIGVENQKRCVFVVARYQPPGNIPGQTRYNVFQGAFDEKECGTTASSSALQDITTSTSLSAAGLTPPAAIGSTPPDTLGLPYAVTPPVSTGTTATSTSPQGAGLNSPATQSSVSPAVASGASPSTTSLSFNTGPSKGILASALPVAGGIVLPETTSTPSPDGTRNITTTTSTPQSSSGITSTGTSGNIPPDTSGAGAVTAGVASPGTTAVTIPGVTGITLPGTTGTTSPGTTAGSTLLGTTGVTSLGTTGPTSPGTIGATSPSTTTTTPPDTTGITSPGTSGTTLPGTTGPTSPGTTVSTPPVAPSSSSSANPSVSNQAPGRNAGLSKRPVAPSQTGTTLNNQLYPGLVHKVGPDEVYQDAEMIGNAWPAPSTSLESDELIPPKLTESYSAALKQDKELNLGHTIHTAGNYGSKLKENSPPTGDSKRPEESHHQKVRPWVTPSDKLGLRHEDRRPGLSSVGNYLGDSEDWDSISHLQEIPGVDHHDEEGSLARYGNNLEQYDGGLDMLDSPDLLWGQNDGTGTRDQSGHGAPISEPFQEDPRTQGKYEEPSGTLFEGKFNSRGRYQTPFGLTTQGGMGLPTEEFADKSGQVRRLGDDSRGIKIPSKFRTNGEQKIKNVPYGRKYANTQQENNR